MHLCFYYGTLKSGLPNHYVLTDPYNGTAVFVGTARTVEKYPLVLAPIVNSPFLVKQPGEGKNIPGEVYQVDDNMLKVLDLFERNTIAYDREQIRVFLDSTLINCTSYELNSDGSVNVWTYLLRDWHPDLMLQPSLDEYNSLVPCHRRRPWLTPVQRGGIDVLCWVKNAIRVATERLIFLYPLQESNGDISSSEEKHLIRQYGVQPEDESSACPLVCGCTVETFHPDLTGCARRLTPSENGHRVTGVIFRVRECLFQKLQNWGAECAAKRQHQSCCHSQTAIHWRLQFIEVETGKVLRDGLMLPTGSLVSCWAFVGASEK